MQKLKKFIIRNSPKKYNKKRFLRFDAKNKYYIKLNFIEKELFLND